MNVLLFLPGLIFILVRNTGLLTSIFHVLLIVATQAVIGLPFLLTFPQSYLARAFEFSRVFQYKWTVNLKFLSESVFVSKQVALALLGSHLIALMLLAHFRWCKKDGGLFVVIKRVLLGSSKKSKPFTEGQFSDTPMDIGFALLSSNFAGIVFARTLHYQFYTWYFHALPFLLWSTRLQIIVKVIVMIGIEYGFNVGNADGAATPVSSLIIQISHLTCLIALLWGSGTPRIKKK